MSIFTSRAQRLLLAGKAPDGVPLEDYPFIQRKGSTYLKFNSIKLENIATGDESGLIVIYQWNGKDMLRMFTEGISFNTGACLQLSGISGEMQMKVTA